MTASNAPQRDARSALAVGSPRPEVLANPEFVEWLQSQNISLAVTTYRANKALLIGRKENGRLSVFERTYERAMALAAAPERLYLATRQQVWRLEARQAEAPYDRGYRPTLSYVTGALDLHDLAVAPDGSAAGLETVYGIATRLSALVRLSAAHGAEVVWTPDFISRVVPEDRCHLNGLAMVEGRPRYVTCVARSDVADGWRDQRADGGLVIDIDSGATVAEGLSMPHSPRWHNGRLWLINAGTGEFGYLEGLDGRAPARFRAVCFCPGFARGLALHDGYAVIGLSQAREATFQGLPLDLELQRRGASARAGLLVVDLSTGVAPHHVRITAGDPTEVYDVRAIPGVRCPRLEGVMHIMPPQALER